MDTQSKEQEVYKKIEEIYNTEKGKGFVTHLIRGFMPTTRAIFMASPNKDKTMKCAITGVSLITQDEFLEFQLENEKEVIQNFKDKILGKTDKNIFSDNFKGKVFAIECKSSTKLLSLVAFEQLVNFTKQQILHDNKHINYIVRDELNKENKKSGSDKIDNFKKREEKKTVTNNIKKQDTPKKSVVATHSLGDSEALQKLKQHFEGGKK